MNMRICAAVALAAAIALLCLPLLVATAPAAQTGPFASPPYPLPPEWIQPRPVMVFAACTNA
ncbi:hypothetical protein [Rhodoligotrophos ferricapiens]|uniref:hypothetical protein n=1 Tax=Rhodoligotrophos ferricapiens TaxID=3069264 RepID=UPI00315CCA6E